MMYLGYRSAFGLLALILASGAHADSNAAPECLAYGKPLAINNQQVLHWKRTTKNQFQERGNIQGTVVQVLPDTSSHAHFVIKIGKNANDTIEVIYNEDFGKMPTPKIGATVQACGDYITATAQSGPYPPSPVGAIIHWVHMNPRGKGHDPGFTTVDGVLYGMDIENAGPRRRETPNEYRRRTGKKRNRGGRNHNEDTQHEESFEASYNF